MALVVPSELNAIELYPSLEVVNAPAAGLTSTSLHDAKAAHKEYQDDLKLYRKA